MQPGHIGWGIWTSWSLALGGGLAVLAAAVVTLAAGCADAGRATAEACAGGVPLTLVQVLTTGGTALALIGGVSATWLTLRRLGWR